MDNNSLSGKVPTTPSNSNPKNISMILGAFVFLLALLFFGAKYFTSEKEEVIRLPEGEPEIVISNVKAEILPDRFPANFPLEKDVPINANYNAETNGSFQSTRQFISQKTLVANYNLYTDFLKKDGWTIGSTLNTDDLKVIFAQKNRSSVTVTINRNSLSGENTIDISFVYR